MRIPTIVLLIWGFALAVITTGDRLKASPNKQRENGLAVAVFADKQRYVRSDSIKFNVMVVNLQSEDTFVYGTLDWGHSASLTMHIRDEMGRTVKPAFLDDALSPPLPSNDNSVFVRLASGHFLGTYYNSTLRQLNISKPGRYSIFVEYHAPYSASKVGVSPFFGSEKGTIRSNVVHIEVRR